MGHRTIAAVAQMPRPIARAPGRLAQLCGETDCPLPDDRGRPPDAVTHGDKCLRKINYDILISDIYTVIHSFCYPKSTHLIRINFTHICAIRVNEPIFPKN